MDKWDLTKLVLFYHVSRNYSVQCKPSDRKTENKNTGHQTDIVL